MSEVQKWHTPPELAKQLGIEPAKVIGWIKSGELRAVNLATKQSRRPRWKISPDSFEEFTRPRESKAVIKPPRRQRRQTSGVIDFYPSLA